jgi:hypothetical protein
MKDLRIIRKHFEDWDTQPFGLFAAVKNIRKFGNFLEDWEIMRKHLESWEIPLLLHLPSQKHEEFGKPYAILGNHLGTFGILGNSAFCVICPE